MNWKRIGRSTVCLLVVAVLLFNISPLQARAIEPISTLTGLGIVAFVILVSAGVVVHVSSPEDIEALGQSFRTSMYQWGTEAEQLDDVEDFFNDLHIYDPGSGGDPGDYRFTIPNAIKNLVVLWMISQVLGEDPVVVPGSGVSFVAASDPAVKEYWQNIDFFSLASAALPGEVMLISSRKDSLSSLYGLRVAHSSAFGVNVLQSFSASDIGPYTTENFPVGEFVSLSSSSVDSWEGTSSVTSDSYKALQVLFLCYDDAYVAYLSGSTGDLYYLMPDSSLEPYGVGSGYLTHGYSLYGRNLGCITTTGEVKTVNKSVSIGYSSNPPFGEYGLLPADFSVLDQTLIGDVAPGIQDGSLSDDAISLPDSFNYSDILTYGGKTGVDSIYDLSNDLQKGDLTYSDLLDLLDDSSVDTGEDPSPDSGSGINPDGLGNMNHKNFFAVLGDMFTLSIVNPLLDGVKVIFVPTEDFLTEKLDIIRSEFGFGEAIVQTVQRFVFGFSDYGREPPVVYINLQDARVDYELGGKIAFIDMHWYAEYKPTVDALLSSFFWLFFLWKLFKQLPGIISGMPGDFVMDTIEAVGWTDRLPSRSMDREVSREYSRARVRWEAIWSKKDPR